MEKIIKSDNKVVLETDMEVSLANAIRRSVNEIPILAFEEIDIYKNDSALYDEILASRVGLIPLKDEKVKEGEFLEFKLKVKTNKEKKDVLSGDFGEGVVYDNIPIVLIEGDQEVEIVGKAKQGKGTEHSKFSPGIIYYHYLNKVKLTKEAETKKELVEMFPKVFALNGGKVEVKNEWALELDQEDMDQIKGVEVAPTKELVLNIESWGQIKASEMFLDSIKALNKNLDELNKELK